MKHAVGIDLGGTSIKGGVVSGDGKVLLTRSIPTQAERGVTHVLERIADFIQDLINESGLNAKKIDGAGIVIPGMIDSGHGIVTYSNNLAWRNVPVAEILKKSFSDLQIKIANDANAAALGEAKYGAGKGLDSSVTITLGTGVGSGIVIGGRLFEGNQGAGAEIGHMVIKSQGGHKCACGLYGCLETCASATALIRDTKAALEKEKNSKMWKEIKNLDDVTPKLAFDFYKIDFTAKRILDKYIENLSIGVINIINIFRPQAVIIGGGMSYQGDNLLSLLTNNIRGRQYGGLKSPEVQLKIAALKNDAGFMGAAHLVLLEDT